MLSTCTESLPRDRRIQGPPPLGPDYFLTSDHRAQPVKKMKEFSARNSRKQIFGAAGVARDFVGKNRAEDDDEVVVEYFPVDVHRNAFSQQPPGYFSNVVLFQIPEALKSV